MKKVGVEGVPLQPWTLLCVHLNQSRDSTPDADGDGLRTGRMGSRVTARNLNDTVRYGYGNKFTNGDGPPEKDGGEVVGLGR